MEATEGSAMTQDLGPRARVAFEFSVTTSWRLVEELWNAGFHVRTTPVEALVEPEVAIGAVLMVGTTEVRKYLRGQNHQTLLRGQNQLGPGHLAASRNDQDS